MSDTAAWSLNSLSLSSNCGVIILMSSAPSLLDAESSAPRNPGLSPDLLAVQPLPIIASHNTAHPGQITCLKRGFMVPLHLS
jgi:hypothetical protein